MAAAACQFGAPRRAAGSGIKRTDRGVRRVRREGQVKTFMLVAMMLGLLVTMWLVARSVQDQQSGAKNPAALRTVERAQEVRQAVEAADKLKEQNLDKAARD